MLKTPADPPAVPPRPGEISEALRALKAEFDAAERERAQIVARIKAIRDDAHPMLAGATVEERRANAPRMEAKAKRQIKAEVQRRAEITEKMERLRVEIVSATSAAMREIAEMYAPFYAAATAAYWKAVLAHRADEWAALADMVATRDTLQAAQIRLPVGLFAWGRHHDEAVDEANVMRAEVCELVSAGVLSNRDIPAKLKDTWRLKP